MPTSNYQLGMIPRIQITTNEGVDITLENIQLEIEVITETIQSVGIDGRRQSEILNAEHKVKAITSDRELAEELYRLIRED